MVMSIFLPRLIVTEYHFIWSVLELAEIPGPHMGVHLVQFPFHHMVLALIALMHSLDPALEPSSELVEVDLG